MIIEYHNSHGNTLVLTLTKEEAQDMIGQLAVALRSTVRTDVSHYVEFKTQFENDNDVFRPTDLDIMVLGDETMTTARGCQPAFPCGKPVTDHPYCPKGPCNMLVDHTGPCFVRT